MVDVAAYLRRIGYDGGLTPDLATLGALMRAHLAAIPFENLDVQLGRPLTTDVDAAFDKLVTRHRGGWCYEMNGVFGAVLEALGYDVTRLAAGVRREQMGDAVFGNHLCLRVELDGAYLVDVGFGGSQTAPVALTGAHHDFAPFHVVFAPLDDGYWRYTETLDGSPFSFDLWPEPPDETKLAEQCSFLQSRAESPFVQNLVLQMRKGGTHLALRGRVLRRVDAAGVSSVTIDSADELIETLAREFGLEVPEAATLWPAICARHEAVFGA